MNQWTQKSLQPARIQEGTGAYELREEMARCPQQELGGWPGHPGLSLGDPEAASSLPQLPRRRAEGEFSPSHWALGKSEPKEIPPPE